MSDSFRFNFLQPHEDAVTNDQIKDTYTATCQLERQMAAMEIKYTPLVPDEVDTVDVNDHIHLMKGRVEGLRIAGLLNDDKLTISDLIPGKYEGGFKLWECALDLCSFLCKEFRIKSLGEGKPLQGKRVLELGCGHGLPGVLCLLAGAEVHFQDYNHEVITCLTMANVHVNSQQYLKNSPSVRFFAGEWMEVGDLMTTGHLGGYYDIILTSETIYSTDSQATLLECIKRVLQPPHGVVYVAAKSYYYGVGGGLAAFKKLLKEQRLLEITTVAKFEDGQSNTREIIKLNFPESITPYFL